MLITQALYHDVDQRMNVYEMDNLPYAEKNALYPDLDKIKANLLAVACLMTSDELAVTVEGFSLSGRVCDLKTRVSNRYITKKSKQTFNAPLAPNEKFRDEPAPGRGTAFLVQPDIIITAGHCVCEYGSSKLMSPEELSKVRVVFGYHKTDANVDKRSFDRNDVYQVKKVLWHKFNHENNDAEERDPDFAIVKLDRPVAGISPIKMEPSTEVGIGREIYVLGCPGGTAVKCTAATVKKINKELIQGDADTFGGNSGGPVIDRVTHKAFAILVCGPEKEYEFDHKVRSGEKRLISRRANTGMFAWSRDAYAGFQIITSEMLVLFKHLTFEVPEVQKFFPPKQDLANDSQVKMNAASIACIISKNRLERIGESFRICLTSTLQQRILRNVTHLSKQPLTKDTSIAGYEEFHDELAPGKGTAFLVRPDIVLTATNNIGIPDLNLSSLQVVFGFQKEDAKTTKSSFPEEDVYTATSVISPWIAPEQTDWTLLKLDRPVKDRKPLSLDFSPVSYLSEIYTLGHDEGASLKFSKSSAGISYSEPLSRLGEVPKNFFGAFFKAGTAGAPVFNSVTHQVIGLITERNVHWVTNEAQKKDSGEARIRIWSTTTCQGIREIPYLQKWGVPKIFNLAQEVFYPATVSYVADKMIFSLCEYIIRREIKKLKFPVTPEETDSKTTSLKTNSVYKKQENQHLVNI